MDIATQIVGPHSCITQPGVTGPQEQRRTSLSDRATALLPYSYTRGPTRTVVVSRSFEYVASVYNSAGVPRGSVMVSDHGDELRLAR